MTRYLSKAYLNQVIGVLNGVHLLNHKIYVSLTSTYGWQVGGGVGKKCWEPLL